MDAEGGVKSAWQGVNERGEGVADLHGAMGERAVHGREGTLAWLARVIGVGADGHAHDDTEQRARRGGFEEGYHHEL